LKNHPELKKAEKNQYRKKKKNKKKKGKRGRNKKGGCPKGGGIYGIGTKKNLVDWCPKAIGKEKTKVRRRP